MIEGDQIPTTKLPNQHLNMTMANLLFRLSRVSTKLNQGRDPSSSEFGELLQAYYEAYFLLEGSVDIDGVERISPSNKKEVVKQMRRFITEVQSKGFYELGMKKAELMPLEKFIVNEKNNFTHD